MVPIWEAWAEWVVCIKPRILKPHRSDGALSLKGEKMELTKAQKFCLEVKELAKQYNLPFFIVTDGASPTHNKDCEAVAKARYAHIQWEKEQGIDPNHDWEK